MEKGMHDVREVNSDIDVKSGTSHIGDTANLYDAIEVGSERDKSTIFVMTEVLPPVVEHLSCENATCSGAQDENTADVTTLLPLDVPIADTANTQTAVHSDVKMMHAVNKLPNSVITRAVSDIVGKADKVEFEFKSNDQSDSCQEQFTCGCSVTITGTVDEETTSDENMNPFPVHQPDPIAADEDPDRYKEIAMEATLLVSPPTDAVETNPSEVQPLTVEAANCLKVADIKN
eukprot:15364608-Ditylum_brightwellii.AAC.1